MIEKNKIWDFETGELLLLDKPFGWTSFDLVAKIRNLVTRKYGLKKLKVGHAGTLDPLATGLMIICTGKFTGRILEFQGLDKEYEAVIELGKTTPSFDLETSFDSETDPSFVNREMVERQLLLFTGNIKQVPPVYSAKYVNGDRAYELARKGERPELKAAQVEIHELELLSFEHPLATLRIRCSKGTYIRSLARDLGQSLGCGAYLKSLKRLAIGIYHLDQAISITEFQNMLYNI